eukprot:GHVS01073220.1.p1 GENE.GHVS01073220.1~~GHVS01073220.1.p1  ORF type:complete len:191 (+),score=37.24 GHVS01073220.1:62-634(+)
MQLDNPSPAVAAPEVCRPLHESQLLGTLLRDDWIDHTAHHTAHHTTHLQHIDEGFVLDVADVYDLIRSLTDPEHPYTLEQLGVVFPSCVVADGQRAVKVFYTPTIPHCSQATLIGLMIRVKLARCLPDWLKADVEISPGTHNTELAVNRQLNDKERVAAALENPALLALIDQGIRESEANRSWKSVLEFL